MKSAVTSFLKMSTFLNVCTGPCADVVKDPAITFPFELDDFQKHAMYHISKEEDVLVTAPTGAGKTILSTYGIAHALRKGKKAIYSSPIKALSNQKFNEMKQIPELGGDIGILTGDIKFKPDARVMIMTTEILRNLLYYDGLKRTGCAGTNGGATTSSLMRSEMDSLSLDEIDCVVFDEVHYINDQDRGKVWEETLVMLPSRITLVMLSATIDKPEKFAAWLANLKQKPVNLIPTSFRPVPLTHWLWVYNDSVVHKSNNYKDIEPETDENRQLFQIMNEKNHFLDRGYDEAWTAFKDKWFGGAKPKYMKGHTEQRTNIMMNHMQVKSSELNPFLQYLQRRRLLPALIFVLSRKNCEVYASSVQITLVSPEERTEIGKIFDSHMHPYFKQYKHLAQYQAVRGLIDKGIGVHHSGLIPILKEIVEILFSRSLVKLLFCTETFAVGVNMPTKTVVFTEMEKFDGHLGRKRLLRTDEYLQMSGRAGRRGKDKIGTVIHFPIRELPSKGELKICMTGQNPEIHSKFTLNYQFILKVLLTREKGNNLLDFIGSSLLGTQQRSIISGLRLEIASLNKGNSGVGSSSSESSGERTNQKEMDERIKEYIDLNETLKTNTGLKQKEVKVYKQKIAKITGIAEFKEAYKAYQERLELASKIKELEDNVADLESKDMLDLVAILSFMQRLDYIDSKVEILPTKESVSAIGKEALQLRGLLAAKISECNELLLTEMVMQGLLDDLTLPELAAMLAIFADSAEGEDDVSIQELVPVHLQERLDRVKKIAGNLQDGEDYYNIRLGTDWQVYLEFILPAYYWTQGDSLTKIYTVTQTYEGNFIKGILKISHIAETLMALADMASLPKLSKQAEELSKAIIRDEVTVNSLYVK